MSDRHTAFTVVLDRNYHESDSKPIADALAMVKGVLRVEPVVAHAESYAAAARARLQLAEQVMNVLYPPPPKEQP